MDIYVFAVGQKLISSGIRCFCPDPDPVSASGRGAKKLKIIIKYMENQDRGVWILDTDPVFTFLWIRCARLDLDQDPGSVCPERLDLDPDQVSTSPDP